MLKIEELKISELAEYKKLIDESFESSNDLEVYKEKYKSDDGYTIIVAKLENKIVGSITFYRIHLFTFSFQPSIEIFNVCVLKEHRRQKIAETLFEYVIDYTKQNGYKSLYLTCLDSALPARKLYEKMGFKQNASVK